MVMAGVQTGGKGVQPLQSMRQTMLDQKLQRAIGHRRLAAKAFGGKTVKNLIGAHGTVAFQQDFQRTTPHRGQAGALILQPVGSLVQRTMGAKLVIMRREGRSNCIIGHGNDSLSRIALLYYILIDLLSHNTEKPPIAINPSQEITMRSLVSIAAILSSTAAPAFAAPNVVTDMSPTGALVQEVMGDLGQVHVLLPKGASAHHYTMRPSDARALQNADLLVWMGPELTPWLDRSADNLSGDTQQLRLLTVEGTILQEYADDDHEGHDHEAHDDHHEHEGHDHDDHHEGHDDHEHHDDHGHDGDGHGDHAGDHDGHDHSGIDPHAWLNPENAAPWLEIIAETLSEQDPENAATYRANAETAADRIAALDAELKTQLAPFSDTSFVVFHDAYNYFTRHYGLKSAVSVSLGDATTPSAARIQTVRDQVIQTEAVCAFPEYAHDPALLETVTEGTQTRIGTELSPEGADGGIGVFDDTFNGLAQTLIACFSEE